MEKNDLTNSLEKMKTYFIGIVTTPTDGVISLFKSKESCTLSHVWPLYAGTFVISFIAIMVGTIDMHDYIDFWTIFRLSLLPIALMLALSLFSFFCKLLFERSTIQQELLVGGISGIVIAAIYLITPLAIWIFNINLLDMLSNPFSGGFLFSLLILFLFLFLNTIFQQSLAAGKVPTTWGWYLAPIAILLAFGAAFKCIELLF